MTAPRTAQVVLLAAVCVLLCSCGIGPEERPRTLPVGGPTAAAAPAATAGTRVMTLYLVRDEGLAPVARRTDAAGSADAALRLLLRGPTAAEGRQGVGSALGADAVQVDQVRQQGSTVLLPLSGSLQDAPRSDEVLAYAQLVATLTALRGIRSVLFLRDGAALSVPRADGSLSTGPLVRGDYAALL